MSDMYAIKASTLTALGDAVREKTGKLTKTITVIEKVPAVRISKTPNATGFNTHEGDAPAESFFDIVNMPQATTIKVKLGWHAYGLLTVVSIAEGEASNSTDFNKLSNKQSYNGTVFNDDYQYKEVIFNSNTLTFYYAGLNNSTYVDLGYYAECIALDADGNEILGEAEIEVEKEVTNTMTPMQMVEEIEGIQTQTPEPIVLTGKCEYACAGPIASEYIKANGDTITTTDISDASYMFRDSTLETIPFELNFKQCSGAYDATKINSMFYFAKNLKYIPDFNVKHADHYADCTYVFMRCESLEQVPYIYNVYPSGIKGLFNYCINLREIPEDYFDTWNLSRVNSYQYADASSIFDGCFSLRSIPQKVLKALIGHETGKKNSSYLAISGLCRQNYALDELINLPLPADELTSNGFGSIVSNCYRLKNFTFETNEDGTPKTAKWKNQTLDLSEGVGIAGTSSYITGYNSGITADKLVTDDATYQALKNDPDWFTTHRGYSRYNHDSAVATINSLPDTSAYGINTIKFLGPSGRHTDGGEINTLTEEEIAVATSRGWTVTFTY